MKLSRKGWLAAGFLAVMSSAVVAAGLFSTLPIVGNGSFCGSTVTGTGNLGGITGQGQGSSGSICGQTVPPGPPVLLGGELIPADTGLSGGAPPQTVTIPSSLLANFSGTPRNYLDNGSLNIQQRGTGTVTCGTTTVPSSAYGPDRWGCFANVTSGAGRTAIVTTAALLPVGFAQVNTLFRTSGALTQPICSIQEVPTSEATALAGKTVTFSVYEAALAGLSADNGNQTTLSIVYGTGSDQGLQTMTASPAITPAWTNVAFAVNQQQVTITTTPTRYSVTGVIPATATEVAALICFTPTATGSGATDGFAYVGAQLEIAPSPSAYEQHNIEFDLAVAERYYWQVNDNVANTVPITMCQATTAAAVVCVHQFPVTMRIAPTATASASTAFGDTATAGAPTACTAFAVVASSTSNQTGKTTCTAGATTTVGGASQLVGANTGANLNFSADF